MLHKDEEYGSYEGIIHHDVGKIINWFSKRGIEYEECIKNLSLPVAFLNNINVDLEFRGNGYGEELYNDFEEECYNNGAESIILESDGGESQRDGFNLDNWYLSLDYEIIGNVGENRLMKKNLF